MTDPAGLAEVLCRAGMAGISPRDLEAARIAVDRETDSIVRYLVKRSRSLLADGPEQALTLSFHAGSIAFGGHGQPECDDYGITVGDEHLFIMLRAAGLEPSGSELQAARLAVEAERSGAVGYLNSQGELHYEMTRANGAILCACAGEVERGSHEYRLARPGD